MNLDTRSLLRRARRLFDNELAPPHVQRHNRHAWVRMVWWMGPKWKLAQPVQRVTE
jgi:hypothetical protein